MEDPVVVVETGHTYEHTAIVRWFETNRLPQREREIEREGSGSGFFWKL